MTPDEQRIATARAAQELRAAADALLRDAARAPKRFMPSDCVKWLRDRADALDPT